MKHIKIMQLDLNNITEEKLVINFLTGDYSADNKYVTVAELKYKSYRNDITICDKMFELFNTWRNINKYNVTILSSNMHSLSVGDIVNIDNNYYICRNFGWEKINYE